MAEYHFDASPANSEIIGKHRANFIVGLALFRCRGDLYFKQAIWHQLSYVAHGRARDYFDVKGQRAMTREVAAQLAGMIRRFIGWL